MLKKSNDLEKRLRYLVAVIVCVAVAVTAAGSLSKRFEAQPTPAVAERGITDLLESERKNLINELWKMEAVEALR